MIPNLTILVDKLNKVLVKDIHVNKAFNLLKKYNGNDWVYYIQDATDTYKKNIIYQNKYYEMVLISWSANANTGFHNHPMNGCLLKVMEGCLNENYNDMINKTISGAIGMRHHGDIHCITTTIPSYSIHIYAPPLFYSTNRNSGGNITDRQILVVP
jgi:hypothetical protein